MTDMLVKLYDLPDELPAPPPGVDIRRALGPEKHLVLAWAARVYSRGWADECELAFCRQPITCFIALRDRQLTGFCVYDATARGMLGPIGVAHEYQRQGIGRQLVVAALKDMAAQGYAYAVVGWAGPEAFFTETVGAIPIPDSRPGLYRDLLSTSDDSPQRD